MGWQTVSKGLIIGLILGLIAGFAGGYYYKNLNAAEPPSTGNNKPDYYEGPTSTMIDPASAHISITNLVRIPSYGDLFRCPTDPGWNNLIPDFIWMGQNMGKAFPLKTNDAVSLQRGYVFSGPDGPFTEHLITPSERFWYGDEYIYTIKRLDTNGDGDIDQIKAVNTVHNIMGRVVNRNFQDSAGNFNYKESDFIGTLDRIATGQLKIFSQTLCVKAVATGSGQGSG